MITRTATVTKYQAANGALKVSVHLRQVGENAGAWQLTDFRGRAIKTQLFTNRADAESQARS